MLLIGNFAAGLTRESLDSLIELVLEEFEHLNWVFDHLLSQLRVELPHLIHVHVEPILSPHYVLHSLCYFGLIEVVLDEHLEVHALLVVRKRIQVYLVL